MANATDYDGRLRELKSALSTRASENDEIVNTAKFEDSPAGKTLMIDEDRRKAFQKNLGEMREIKGLMAELQEQKGYLDYGSAVEQSSVALAHAAGGGSGSKGYSSFGDGFINSEEFKAFKASGASQMNGAWEVEGIDLGGQWKGWGQNTERKDVYNDLPTGNTGGTAIPGGFAPVQRDPMVLRSFRKNRVRDLFPVQQTTSGLIEYFRVTGFTGNSSASVVPDRVASTFGAKPHTSLSFVGDQMPVRTIAHWEAAHRNVLDDVPQLRDVIDNELLYGLRLHEDYQILYGTGTGQDLRGILLDPGIQTYARPGTPAANENKADDVRRASTKALLAYYEPTGVVMHPNDWEDIELLKDTTGAYIVAVAVALGGTQRLWRLPVVDTPAINEGTFAVGAFGLGVQLYDRMAANIRITESHSDFFIRNAVLVLCEERICVVVKRPESLVKGTFGA